MKEVQIGEKKNSPVIQGLVVGGGTEQFPKTKQKGATRIKEVLMALINDMLLINHFLSFIRAIACNPTI
jgi:hypothetical protein